MSIFVFKPSITSFSETCFRTIKSFYSEVPLIKSSFFILRSTDFLLAANVTILHSSSIADTEI
jgi:hypothetical protein